MIGAKEETHLQHSSPFPNRIAQNLTNWPNIDDIPSNSPSKSSPTPTGTESYNVSQNVPCSQRGQQGRRRDPWQRVG